MEESWGGGGLFQGKKEVKISVKGRVGGRRWRRGGREAEKAAGK